MDDHPILGAVLIAIGTALVGLASYTNTNMSPEMLSSLGAADAKEAISYLVVGFIVVANGVLLVVLGSRKSKRARTGG